MQALWSTYWTQHSLLHPWHAQTLLRRAQERANEANGWRQPPEPTSDDSDSSQQQRRNSKTVALGNVGASAGDDADEVADVAAAAAPTVATTLYERAMLTDREYIPPFDASGASWNCDLAVSVDSSTPNPDVELLFAALCRRMPVIRCSFVRERHSSTTTTAAPLPPYSKGRRPATPPPPRDERVFRARLPSVEAATYVRQELQSIPFTQQECRPLHLAGSSNGEAAGETALVAAASSLELRSAMLGTLVELGHTQLHGLFVVFGPCEVQLPSAEEIGDVSRTVERVEATPHTKDLPSGFTSPAIVIRYTDPTPWLAVADAAAAVRGLQRWLSFDWSAILTYATPVVVATPVSPAESTVSLPPYKAHRAEGRAGVAAEEGEEKPLPLIRRQSRPYPTV